MTKAYVLGVDGGNTKTQYCLFDLDGNRVDEYRTGTCSHEKMPGGFAGCKTEMSRQLDVILSRNGLNPGQIAFSVFGLAGADFGWQKTRLEKIVFELGFSRFIVENDGFIALKAGSPSGCGVCSINGTGTVTIGIGPQGQRLQLGGIGMISGDEGGGAYLAQCAAAAVYDQLFRCGPVTVLTDMLFDRFSIGGKSAYAEDILEILRTNDNMLAINLMLGEAERLGDRPAIRILTRAGVSLGATVSGCIRELGFTDRVTVVLAGSVWVKGGYQSMLAAFKQVIERNVALVNRIEYRVLKQAPAMGAVKWALEQAGRPQSARLANIV